MITVKQKYKFLGGLGATKVTYTLTPDNTCATVTPSSGTVDVGTTVEFTFQFQDSNCFDTNFTLNGSYNNDCPDATPYIFSIPTPCSSLVTSMHNAGLLTNPYKFNLNISGGTQPYTVTWNYDTSLFNLVSSSNSGIEFTLKNSSNTPDVTIVTATIVDANGCEAVRSVNYTFCRPIASNFSSLPLHCITPEAILKSFTASSVIGGITLQATPCSGNTIDWSTVEFTYDTNNLYVLDNGDGTINVYGKDGGISGNYNITYSVADDKGLRSNDATLTVSVPSCNNVSAPVLQQYNYKLAPTDTISTELIIPLENKVFISSTEDIDWDSFTFVAATGQTLVASDDLTATNGNADYLCGEREIKYTVGSKTENVDLIQFKLSTESGKVSNTIGWTFDYESIAVPTGVADSLTLAAGESSDLDVSANDGGDIDYGSYQIVANPSKVKVRNNGDGSFNVYAPPSTEGSDSFTYNYQDANGNLSNTVTVTITIQNAGTGTTETICGVAGVDLTSFLSGSVTAGGSWSADSSNPSSPSIVTPSSVDFSAANAGTYLFTYTVGSSSATITLILPDYSVTIDSVSTPTSNPIAGSVTSLVNFTTIGLNNINDIEIEVNYNTGVNIDTYSPDTWNSNTGQGNVTIEYGNGAGSYVITVTITDNCGDTQTDNKTITIS